MSSITVPIPDVAGGTIHLLPRAQETTHLPNVFRLDPATGRIARDRPSERSRRTRRVRFVPVDPAGRATDAPVSALSGSVRWVNDLTTRVGTPPGTIFTSRDDDTLAEWRGRTFVVGVSCDPDSNDVYWWYHHRGEQGPESIPPTLLPRTLASAEQVVASRLAILTRTG